tara:strand:- start:56 stop:922 length:867 start_codon:yes stop_codon:yes gene_type:complete
MLEISEKELKEILPLEGPSLNEVKKYLNKYNDEYVVIKCGGSVLVDKNLFNNFIDSISILHKLGFLPIIIHGGGKKISNKLEAAGIKKQFINGLRVTNEKSIKIVDDVLNIINKEITIALNNNGCSSQSVNNREKNIIRVFRASKELGFVGTPSDINQSVIEQIIKEKKVPVVAPLGLDKDDNVYNVNADTVAGAIAKKLNARRLIIMSDVEGVLDKNKELLFEIDSQDIKKLIANKTIDGGMIPKIENCLDVAQNGVKGVVIIDGRKNHSILFELLSDKGSGTLIRK